MRHTLKSPQLANNKPVAADQKLINRTLVIQLERLEMVEFFLEKGIDVNDKEDEGFEDAFGELLMEDTDLMKQILEYMQEVMEKYRKTSEGRAAYNNHLHKVLDLLVDHGFKGDSYLGGELMEEAIKGNLPEIAKRLFEHGYKVGTNSDERLMLIKSVTGVESYDLVKVFVENGLEVLGEAQCSALTSVIGNVAKTGSLDMFKLFVDGRNADELKYFLPFAALTGNLEVVQYMEALGVNFKKGSSMLGEIKLDDGRTFTVDLWSRMCEMLGYSGSIDLYEYIMGQNEEERESSLQSILISAARSTKLDMVRYLEGKGGKVNDREVFKALMNSSNYEAINLNSQRIGHYET